MNRVIISRYGKTRTLTLLSDKLVSIVANDNLFTRILGDPSNPVAIDFDGGPFIAIGNILTLDNKYRVDKIIPTESGNKFNFEVSAVD